MDKFFYLRKKFKKTVIFRWLMWELDTLKLLENILRITEFILIWLILLL